MKYNHNERLEIGRKYYPREMSESEIMIEYDISRSSVHSYCLLYKKSIGTNESRREQNQKPQDIPEEYLQLNEKQLIRELMKKDIEIERLKKGYQVKGDSTNKEFVTIFDANTK